MPGPAIADVATWAAITTPPADGDRAAIAAGAGPLRTNVIQLLADRDRFLLNALNGALSHEPEIFSTDGINVRVKPFSVILGEKVLTLAAETGYAFPGPTIGWWYVYCYDNAGAIGVQLSVTAPEASLTFKTGTTTHRYLGAVRSVDGATITPFRKCGRTTIYLRNWSGTLPVLTAGVAAGYVTIPLLHTAVDLLPPHAQLVELEVFMAAAGTGDLKQAAANPQSFAITSTSVERHTLHVAAGGGKSVDYQVAAGSMTIRVYGWHE